MKKHLKILTALGLSMPLALAASAQASGATTGPSDNFDEGSKLKTHQTSSNLVINRIADFSIEKSSQYDLGHVNVHNDNQPHTDHHTDKVSPVGGNHADYHSDTYGQHTDNHLDTGDNN